jgi:hypothetical protein
MFSWAHGYWPAGSGQYRPMTRGDVLSSAIAFALRRARKIIRGLKEGLTEDERYAVADHVVSQLKEHGDPWHLSDGAKPGRGPTT